MCIDSGNMVQFCSGHVFKPVNEKYSQWLYAALVKTINGNWVTFCRALFRKIYFLSDTCMYFREKFDPHLCLAECVNELTLKKCGCIHSTNGKNRTDVKMCGQLPDSYPPYGCVWTENQTVLENQMDVCLEPLRLSNKSLSCHKRVFFMTLNGRVTFHYWHFYPKISGNMWTIT